VTLVAKQNILKSLHAWTFKVQLLKEVKIAVQLDDSALVVKYNVECIISVFSTFGPFLFLLWIVDSVKALLCLHCAYAT